MGISRKHTAYSWYSPGVHDLHSWDKLVPGRPENSMQRERQMMDKECKRVNRVLERELG